MIQAQFSGEKVVSNSADAYSLYEKSHFGEKIRKKIEYSFVEALYLLERSKLKIFSGKKELNFDSLIEKMKRKDKKIELKYAVYSDMRDKGYILKTALKFGGDFRVYEKGVRPGEDHALWILFAARENEQLRWHEFTAKNRVAHSTKKKLLLGIVDEEGDISYYQCDWAKL